jgi:hypothetical protein
MYSWTYIPLNYLMSPTCRVGAYGAAASPSVHVQTLQWRNLLVLMAMLAAHGCNGWAHQLVAHAPSNVIRAATALRRTLATITVIDSEDESEGGGSGSDRESVGVPVGCGVGGVSGGTPGAGASAGAGASVGAGVSTAGAAVDAGVAAPLGGGLHTPPKEKLARHPDSSQ